MTSSNAAASTSLPGALLIVLVTVGCGAASPASFSELSPAEQALVVQGVEDEVVRTREVSDTLEDNLLSLVASYRTMARTERASPFLKRVRAAAPAAVYASTLGFLASEIPEAVRVDDSDASLLVADVERQALADSESIAWHHFGEATQLLLEHVRLTTARSYATVLVRSAHVEAAREVLRIGMEGATEPRCKKMLGVVGQRRGDAIVELVCERCTCEARSP